MTSNNGGRLMNQASGSSNSTQEERNAKARAKMQRQLRKRGHREPTAHLSTHALIELIEQTLSEDIHYNKRMMGNYRTNRPQWVEVDLAYYLHTLNALPPRAQLNLGHVMGSSFGYNGSGEPVWFCFLQVSDRHRETHFLGKICTLEQWRAAYLGATYEAQMRIFPRSCDECGGNGKDPGQSRSPEPCPVCNGKGEFWPDLRKAVGNTTEF